MRYLVLLYLARFLLPIAAFGDAGAYERLWFWYAYQMDTSGVLIANGCSKFFSTKARCTFSQFVQYIESNRINDRLNPSALNGVDTTDVVKTTSALSDGRYTGLYDIGLIHSDVTRQDNTVKLFTKMDSFFEKKVSKATPELRKNLQQVTAGIARLRQENAAIGMAAQLQRDYGISSMQTKQVETFPGSGEFCDDIDIRATAVASGVQKEDVKKAILAIKINDPGHNGNIKAILKAAAKMLEACRNL